MKQNATLLLALALLLGGCAEREQARRVPVGEIRMIESPAGAGSLTPNLHVGTDGNLYLSWLAHLDSTRTALRYAVREGGRWTAPRTVAAGTDWFVNWADFPSVVALEGDALAAHILVKSGAKPYAYDVHVFRSADGGETWSEAVVPHRDGTPTEHGFVSLVPGRGDTLGIIWLDGREYASGEREMTLRYAAIGPEGDLARATRLDGRTCDCCQTAAARTPRGVVVAYRDRSPEEVRDISIVRRVDGRWTEPRALHADGWKIAACPVNGPALDAAGERVAVAWFTAADGRPRVYVAFSDDAGATFDAPMRVSEGRTLGRVDVAWTGAGTALVSWMETTPQGAALRVRPVSPGGAPGPVTTVTPMDPARASGFPQMAVCGDSAYFAWTVPGTPGRLRMAVAPLSVP